MARHYLKPRARRYAINTRSPYTRGLQRLFLPQGNELEAPGTAGGGLWDYATDARPTTVTIGTTATQGLQESVAGPGLRWGSTAGAIYITFPVRNEARNAMTIWWHGIYHSDTAILMRDASGGGGTIPVWRGASGFDARIGGTDYTEAGAWTTGAPTSVLLSSGAAAMLLYGNGDLVISGGAPGATALASPWYLHKNGTNPNGAQATLISLAIWNYAFSQQECEGFLADPYGALVDARQYEQTSNVQWMFGVAAAPGGFSAAWARPRSAVIGAGVR